MKTIIIYHRDADGFGAAYSAWREFGGSAIYRSWQYGEPPDFDLCRGNKVHILDFSFDREETERIRAAAEFLVILDHHISAKNNLDGLPYFHYSEHSGAVMAWEYFMPNTQIPLLLRYVEDRDLWKFELPDSREVSYGLASYAFDFRVWHELIAKENNGIKELATDGAAIMRHIDMNVDRLIAAHARDVVIDGNKIKAVNCPLYQSEIAGKLAEMGLFGTVYYDSGNQRVYSLRSRSDLDVSEIATKYGGGGHKNASGFHTPI